MVLVLVAIVVDAGRVVAQAWFAAFARAAAFVAQAVAQVDVARAAAFVAQVGAAQVAFVAQAVV